MWGEPARLPLLRSFIELGGRIKEVQRVPAGLARLVVLFVFKGFRNPSVWIRSSPSHKLLSAPAQSCSRIQQGFVFSWELLCDGNALCIPLVHVSLTLEVSESLQILAEDPRSHVGKTSTQISRF